MTYTLVLLRHGESDWNAKNLFTGWVDVPLSEKGRTEAETGGGLLAEAGVLPDVVHTSLLRRAITTANLALDVADRHWIPVHAALAAQRAALRRAAGQEQEADPRAVRRGAVHALAPLVRRPAAADRGRRRVQPGRRPALRRARGRHARAPSASRTSSRGCCPTGTSDIVPDLRAGKVVLVAAHGNSLRALVKHLDGISDDDIAGLNIPTGMPLVYELDDDLAPTARGGRYLDPAAAAAAAAAVANQGR